jgi:hypothetical protein
LLVASLGIDRRAQVRRVALGSEFAVGAELPALLPDPSPPVNADEALVVSAAGEAVAFGLSRLGDALHVMQLAPVRRELGTLPLAQERWITGCADEQRFGFAVGNGRMVQLGELRRDGTALRVVSWPALPLATSRAIHPELGERDRVRRLCTPYGALLVARAADDQLLAVACAALDAPCRVLPIASKVEHFALLQTPRGALIAYAGSVFPQVWLRSLDLATRELDPARIPAACWARGGLCGRPTLARLGQRVLLLTPDKTDLLALESADDGESWSAPPVL